MDCFFFEIPHESVRVFGEEQVSHKVQVEENTLTKYDHNSEKDAWVLQIYENKEMHAFIFCFFKHVMDPAIVSLKSS